MLRRNSSYIFAAVFLAALFMLGGCAPPAAQDDLRPVVRVHKVAAQKTKDAVIYPGEVRGRYEQPLAFQIGGKVAERLVDVGSYVEKDSVLMRLDTRDAAQLVSLAAAQLDAARGKLALDKLNHERAQALLTAGALSVAQSDQSRTQYETSLSAYRQAQAQYAQSANALDYTILTANTEGVIAALQAEAGQVVAAGQPVLLLVEDSELEIEINVPETRRNDIAQGQAAAVFFWALPGIAATGQVREVSPVADQITRTYKTKISLDNPPPVVRFGMTASVTLPGQDQAAIYIPLSCLYQTGEQSQVWVAKDGKAALRAVTVGRLQDSDAEITAGLSDGELVVSAGTHKLRDGQEIRFAAGNTP